MRPRQMQQGPKNGRTGRVVQAVSTSWVPCSLLAAGLVPLSRHHCVPMGLKWSQRRGERHRCLVQARCVSTVPELQN